MYKIVFLRHGESVWNKENRFTGWTDVELSEKGIQEAHEAGKTLKQEGYAFDLAFNSELKRATQTLEIVLEEMGLLGKIPVQRSWRLNERHYGALQGLNKSETAEKYGEDQVKIWRRSYDIRPPLLDPEDPRHGVDHPLGECLKDTVQRAVPYWTETIVPALKSGKKILVSAHGNSLRALVKYLDQVSDAEIVELNIPTGIPLVYELDADLKPIRHYYLGDAAAIAAAQEKVKNQGKKA